MRKIKFVLAGLPLALFLAGCADSGNSTPRSQQVWVPDGDPVTCINLRQIRSTHVVDDRTINFVMGSNRMFRNELPFACSGLGFSRAFKHNSRTSQLCSMDSITVIQGGRATGARCSLGRFQPMKPAPAAETPVPANP
jgi:Family of unknown function (DUF6491)